MRGLNEPAGAEPCCEAKRICLRTRSEEAATWLTIHSHPTLAAWAEACTARAPEWTK